MYDSDVGNDPVQDLSWNPYSEVLSMKLRKVDLGVDSAGVHNDLSSTLEKG